MGLAMYVLAGFVQGLITGRVLKSDSRQGTWSEVAPMPHARRAYAACTLGSDIYVLGGSDDRGAGLASVFKYNTVANIWTTLAPMQTFGIYPGVTTLDGRIYLTGMGFNGKEVLLFDLASRIWSSLAHTMHNRRQGSLFVLNGCLHAAGGNPVISSVERYDAGTDTWTAVADMLEGRRVSGAVTIPAVGPAEKQNLFDALIVKATR
jgi:hypothetical protein